jgi:hypothetical protein
LTPTLDLHKHLQGGLRQRDAEYAAALKQANEALHQQKITFGGSRDMATGLSALLLNTADRDVLAAAASMTHRLVEKTLDWLADSPDRLQRHFPHLQRVFRFLRPTAGWRGKQVVSRYDAVVTPQGELRIIELNTCCPAGFLHSEAFCCVTQQALQTLDPDNGFDQLAPGAIAPYALVDGLLEVEAASGLTPGLIAALTDENQIQHELDLLLNAVRSKTPRDIEIVDARELTFRDGRLWRGKEPISLTYNKFRISVPNSQNHCWRVGFEERYAAYLEAVERGAVATVNNFFGMTLGEDKGLMALWAEPELVAQFTPEEREFVERHVAWTRPLTPSQVEWQGEMIRLPDFLLEHPEHFVIKPAGEGRGFGVVIGKYASAEAWRQACTPDENSPCVVQEFAEPVHLPVVVCRSGQVALEKMFLTVALATVCGQYQGLLSRVSSNPVTNVARTGMVQAVLIG